MAAIGGFSSTLDYQLTLTVEGETLVSSGGEHAMELVAAEDGAGYGRWAGEWRELDREIGTAWSTRRVNPKHGVKGQREVILGGYPDTTLVPRGPPRRSSGGCWRPSTARTPAGPEQAL